MDIIIRKLANFWNLRFCFGRIDYGKRYLTRVDISFTPRITFAISSRKEIVGKMGIVSIVIDDSTTLDYILHNFIDLPEMKKVITYYMENGVSTKTGRVYFPDQIFYIDFTNLKVENIEWYRRKPDIPDWLFNL